MRPLVPTVLEGRHVRLVPLRPEHASALRTAVDDDEVSAWLSVDLRDPAQFDAWLETTFRALERGEEAPFAVELRATGTIVGSTRFMDIRPAHRGVEIGWTWYSKAVWGGLVNPECKYLLMRHAFEEWGAIRVCLKTDNLNLHSQRAIVKLGAKYEGTLRRHYVRRDGTYRDSVYFSVIDSEWPAVKTSLERRIR